MTSRRRAGGPWTRSQPAAGAEAAAGFALDPPESDDDPEEEESDDEDPDEDESEDEESDDAAGALALELARESVA